MEKTDDEEEGQAFIIRDVFRLLAPGNATLEFGPSTLPSLPLSCCRKPHSLPGAPASFVTNNKDASSAVKMCRRETKVLHKKGMQARVEHSCILPRVVVVEWHGCIV